MGGGASAEAKKKTFIVERATKNTINSDPNKSNNNNNNNNDMISQSLGFDREERLAVPYSVKGVKDGSSGGSFYWQYSLDEASSEWLNFPDDINEILEQAYMKMAHRGGDGQEGVVRALLGKKNLISIDIAQMKFNFANGGAARPIQRRRRKDDFSDPFAVPWDGAPNKSNSDGLQDCPAGEAADGQAGDACSSPFQLETRIKFEKSVNPVYCIAATPDGGGLITGDKFGYVRFWDATSCHNNASFHFPSGRLLGHSGDNSFDEESSISVLSLAHNLATAAAGRQFVACGDNTGTVRVIQYSSFCFEAPSSPPVLTVKAHSHKVYSLDFTCDNRNLITCSMNNDINIYDMTVIGSSSAEHKPIIPLAALPNCHDASIFAVRASRHTPWLLFSGGDDNVIHSFDLRLPPRAGGPRTATYRKHTGTIWSIDLRYDDQMLASCGKDGSVILWDTRRPSPEQGIGGGGAAPQDQESAIRVFSELHDGPVQCVEFIGHGESFITCGRDANLRLTGVNKEPRSGGGTAAAHRGCAFKCTHNAATNRVVTCGSDSSIAFWRLTH